MSPQFEAFVARLYVDAAARRRFSLDPGGEAASAGLTADEITAALRIDRVGLELAAAGFAHKRRSRRGPVARWWRRLTARISRA